MNRTGWGGRAVLLQKCRVQCRCSSTASRRKVTALSLGEQVEPPLALKLAGQYATLQKPAKQNMLYTDALRNFTRSAILAYECGYTEELVSSQLQGELDKGTSLLPDLDQAECLSSLCIVWITVILTPARSVTRWAQGSPVSQETMDVWRGFVQMIVMAYFKKRWAWYPIDRLQLELNVTAGRSESPSDVAEWAQLVYITLEMIAPQFPTR